MGPECAPIMEGGTEDARFFGLHAQLVGLTKRHFSIPTLHTFETTDTIPERHLITGEKITQTRGRLLRLQLLLRTRLIQKRT